MSPWAWAGRTCSPPLVASSILNLVKGMTSALACLSFMPDRAGLGLRASSTTAFTSSEKARVLALKQVCRASSTYGGVRSHRGESRSQQHRGARGGGQAKVVQGEQVYRPGFRV